MPEIPRALQIYIVKLQWTQDTSLKCTLYKYLPYTVQCRSYRKNPVNQLYNYSTVLGAAIKCKLYSEITAEIGTHLKTVKITSNILSVGINFRNARGLARVTYSGTPVGSVVDICHKNEMQCSSFQKFTSFFEHILLQNCLVALPYQPSSQQKYQEVSSLNFPLGLSIFIKTF